MEGGGVGMGTPKIFTWIDACNITFHKIFSRQKFSQSFNENFNKNSQLLDADTRENSTK